MRVKKFRKKIKHLSHAEIVAGAISSLNLLLVDKGITTKEELQSYFLKWLKMREKSVRNQKDKARTK